MECGVTADVYVVSFWGYENDGFPTLNTIKTIELYILNGWVFWHVSYISVKLSKINYACSLFTLSLT